MESHPKKIRQSFPDRGQIRRKSPRNKKKKASLIKSIVKLIKRNPFKAIAILFGCILVYVSILFIIYANENKPAQPNQVRIKSKETIK